MKPSSERFVARRSSEETGTLRRPDTAHFIGVDAGAETIKLIELERCRTELCITRQAIVEHGKKPGPVLVEALRGWDWHSVTGAAVSGRFASQINLPPVPVKQAQLRGYQFLYGDEPATLVNIGSHGFTVLEMRASGQHAFRENSRCSQGTGNFLRQLVERFSLSVEEASALCADIENPAPVSGRCPVILKTDMTHLANKGEDRARILAGLFDAVCENVLVLIKPGGGSPRVFHGRREPVAACSPRIRSSTGPAGDELARRGGGNGAVPRGARLCADCGGSADATARLG
jgi:activator of 2-hydroxyglutaryl-CoA dehydratase